MRFVVAATAGVVFTLAPAGAVSAPPGRQHRAPERVAPALKVNRFDERRAYALLKQQVAFGPRPAGSTASQRLGALLRSRLPGGRFQRVPGGLRNVLGVVAGKNPRRFAVVGAHYDTIDLPRFVGANDGASGTAVVVQLARTLKPRSVRPTVVFILFDGEEQVPGGDYATTALRGSRVAAQTYRKAEAAVVLDMIGDRDLRVPREQLSDPALWRRIRHAATRVGAAKSFPPVDSGPILDDHTPFRDAGVPAVDVIDFTFPCWHLACDDLTAVSAASLDAVGETMVDFLRHL